MKLITFATFEEAEATLSAFNAKPEYPGFYSSDFGPIAITGIGPFAAYIALTPLSKSFDSILNIGLAGALRGDLELGTIHPIKTTHKYLWHPKGQEKAKNCLLAHLKGLKVNETGLQLATVDFPVHIPKALNDEYDLVDMEGYGLALLAESLGKKCELYKLISDYCTADTASQIAKNLPHYSQAMASFLQKTLIQDRQ